VKIVRGFVYSTLFLVLSGCTNLIFHPMRPHYTNPDVVNVRFEDVFINTEDNIRLHGWKLSAEQGSNGAVIYFHGNGENISTHFLNVYWLTLHGFDVYLYDYRGYGRSEGFADLDAVIRDIETMIATTLDNVPAQQNIVVMGHSLGGSLSIFGVAHSQHRERIAALVSIDAFSDYHEVTQDVLSRHWLTWLLQWPLSFTVDNSYRPIDSTELVSPVPWLIMHSKNDEIVPFYHAEVLYEAAREPKRLVVTDSTHNNIFNKKMHRDLLLQYLQEDLPAIRALH